MVVVPVVWSEEAVVGLAQCGEAVVSDILLFFLAAAIGFCAGMAFSATIRRKSAASPPAPPAPPEPEFVISPGDIVEVQQARSALMRARVLCWDRHPSKDLHVLKCREMDAPVGSTWYVPLDCVRRILARAACPSCGQSVPERGYREAEKP